MENILITGGTGLIGTHLSKILFKEGYATSYLSRYNPLRHGILIYHWDPKAKYMSPNAFKKIDHIIHLSGSRIADHRWTNSFKKEIERSRVNSTLLLYNKLKELPNQIKTFISASAIGIYGDKGEEWVNENSVLSNNFLGRVCRNWEEQVMKINELGIRVVILRLGVVLSGHGGALSRMLTPIKLGIGAPLGNGNQYMSWIHIDDLANLFVKALKDGHLRGVYNAVSPNPVTNKEFTKTLADVLNKPLFLPAIPGFILKIIFGQMSSLFLESARVTPKKIMDTGFQFQFPELKEALLNFNSRVWVDKDI